MLVASRRQNRMTPKNRTTMAATPRRRVRQRREHRRQSQHQSQRQRLEPRCGSDRSEDPTSERASAKNHQHNAQGPFLVRAPWRNSAEGADIDVVESGQVIEIMTDFYAQPRNNGTETSYVTEAYATETKEKRQNKMKRRLEVSVRQLTREDRERFIKAKGKEWTSWLDKKAVEIIKNKSGIPRTHILRARWVLTWKSVGTAKEPKARLCVLGYTDPRLTTLETSSPTLTGDGEALIMQWVVNHAMPTLLSQET